MSGDKKRKLPEGWKWKCIKDICLINPSKRKDFFREPNSLTSFVPMEVVDYKLGRITQTIKRNYIDISKGYTFFEEEDVLFAKITPCMQNGKSAIAKNLIDGIGFGSTEFHVLRPKDKNEIIKEWIYFYLRTVEFRKRAENHFEGSAGQQRVSTHFLENTLIPLPPTPADQLSIASDLEHRMAHVEKMRVAALRQKEAIASMQGSILREAFPYEEGDELPEGWRWKIIKDVMENNIQVFNPENYDKEKFIYIDISSVDNLSKKILNTNQVLVKEAPSRAKSILKENDIIISTVRPNLNAVALVDKSRAGNICSSGFCVIRLKNGYHASYLFYYLTSPYFVEAISNMVQGAMYPAISNDDVKDFSIPLPPLLSDQIAIASELERKVSELEKARQTAQRQVEAIKALPGAILREVFDFEEENTGS